jgi:hypothetical protein
LKQVQVESEREKRDKFKMYSDRVKTLARRRNEMKGRREKERPEVGGVGEGECKFNGNKFGQYFLITTT